MGPTCSFQLLAPSESRLTAQFASLQNHEQSYDHFLASMQKLRGQAYLKDGAIQPSDLDSEGRFVMAGDEESWHLLLVDVNREVIGCAKYLVHGPNVQFHRLKIAQSPLANDPFWGERVRRAVDADLRRVREEKLHYVEVGGWALAEEWRGTRAALEILVGSFALGQIWGGAIGSCTATARHSSASMLRRLGGQSFESMGEPIPAYEDQHYGCTMELLRFDYRTPSKRFLPLITPLKATLSNGTVLTRHGQLTGQMESVVGERPSMLSGLQPAFLT